MSENTELGRIGTVAAKNEEGLQIQFDGDEETGEKYYKCNTSIRFDVGDRVLTLPISGTYIVFCKIGAPGGPVSKTDAMVNAVGADGSGKLYTTPAEEKVKPVAKTKDMTQDVGVDSTTGKLYTAPATSTEPEYARGLRYNGSARVTLDMDNNYNLVPSDDLTSYGAGLGTASKYFQRAYIGSGAAKIGSKASSKIAFYGATPITQPVLSTVSANMSYSSATASNYLTIINNIAGILKKLGLLA